MKKVTFSSSFNLFNFPSFFFPPTPFFFEKGEHYKLLSWISLSIKGNYRISDIGTYQGASAYALSVNENAVVYSYGPEGKVLTSCIAPNIFYIDGIWEDYIDDISKSSLILFDTLHDGIQESTFMNAFLEKFHGNFCVIIFDDIYLNKSMVKFWNELQEKNSFLNFYDFTSLGHSTGTGIVSVNLTLEEILEEELR